MTIKKITNFVFPVGQKELSRDACFRALAESQSGFYPFGENGIWHGGIHIDADVLREINCNDKRMYCIGNGEVIAYRVNDIYPKASYGKENIKVPFIGDDLVAYFSSGFTLVRHYFRMPKVAGESTEPPYITLYSLYMHQLDWYGYQQYNNHHSNHPLQIPTFWHLTEGKVSSATKENIKGSAIRIKGSSTEIVGLLLKDSKIKLGDEIVRYDEKKKRISRGWYELKSLESGCIVTDKATHYQLGSIKGYIYAPELKDTIESDSVAHKAKIYSVKVDKNDTVGLKQSKVLGIVVYGDEKGKNIKGYLPKGASFEFDGQENGFAKITKINCNYIPSSLIIADENTTENSPVHQGWVKLSSLSSLKHRPKELDKVVVLDKPVEIKGGDLIGHLGHSVNGNDKFAQREPFALATIKRADNDKLSLLGHIELFTCDNLPDFMTKTRALAKKLPESEKSLIIVESGAQLIKERLADGKLPTGLHIKKITTTAQSHYIQVRIDYVLSLKRRQCIRENIAFSNRLNAAPSVVTYQLTAENKKSLVRNHLYQHPELKEENIPDEVELIGYEDSVHATDIIKVRFNRFDKALYWIKTDDMPHKFAYGNDYYQNKDTDDTVINQPISYWRDFPLSLNDLAKATLQNTVHYGRTLQLTSIRQENLTATDANNNTWAYISAGNQEGIQIQGWVNLAKGEKEYLQPHIKRASPWEWIGFEVIEEQAKTGELAQKIKANRKVKLDLADYTKGMSALHHILTQTPMNTILAKKGQLPPFTKEHLKEGLRTPWTSEQIGRLVIKYESEWYADDNLTKWNEIDEFYKKAREEKHQEIESKLNELNITSPAQREQAFKYLTQVYQQNKDEWQIEKAQRIKPSLWWKEVAEAQAQASKTAQSQNNEQNETTNPNTPILSNLSQDGKAWYLHPVGVKIFTFSEIGIVFNVVRNNLDEKYVISYESYDNLILYHEGFSSIPYVPRNSETSGISLGYGYDLGHQKKDIVLNELSEVYKDEHIHRLISVIGKKGDQARLLLPSVEDIVISKDAAKRLSIISKSRYAQQVVDIYPESIELSTHQKGALLSLIYNRGNSLKGSRRDEMREIQNKLKEDNLIEIPDLFRAMKRLWEGSNQTGLLKRREDEALYFEKGFLQ